MTLPGEFLTERAAKAEASVHLRVLATSDLHAHLLPFDYYTDRRTGDTGLARLSTVIAAARAAARNSILVDNGDTLQGAPLADAAVAEIVPAGRMHPMIATMNAIGFDAATLGNHDFDFGLGHLEACLADAAFPIVLANARRADGTDFLATRTLLKRDVVDSLGDRRRIKIGITGCVPPQVTAWNRAVLEGRLKVGDIVPAIQEQVIALRADGADVVLVLAHSGPGAPKGASSGENVAYLLAGIPGIDAVIAGHTHSVLPDAPPAEVFGVPIVQPGAHGSHLGCIDLVLRAPPDLPAELGVERRGANAGWAVHRARAGNFPLGESSTASKSRVRRLLPDFPEVRNLIAREHRATRAYVDKALGATAVPLQTFFSTLAPCAATQVIADAQLANIRPLLANSTELSALPLLSAAAPFKAGGRSGPGSYTDVPIGPLKLRHAADLYIYPNLISVVRIDGRGLRDWLERSVSIYNQIVPDSDAPQTLIDPEFAPYNFDRIVGLFYQVDISRPPRTNAEGDQLFDTPGRIVNLRFADGRPVQPDDEALVITNSYRSAGGGHFPCAAAATEILTGPTTVRDAVARYMNDANGPLQPQVAPSFDLRPLAARRVVFTTGSGALRHPAHIAALGLTRVEQPTGPLDPLPNDQSSVPVYFEFAL